MSDKKKKDEGGDAPKGKGKLGLILVAVGMLVVGGGGAAAAMMFLGGGHEEKKDHGPQLIRKGEEDPYAPPAAEGEGEEGTHITNFIHYCSTNKNIHQFIIVLFLFVETRRTDLPTHSIGGTALRKRGCR